MKVYTRGGDEGKTSLYDGSRVAKSDPRVAVYGTIDELNAALGLVRSLEPPARVRTVVQRLQNELFTLGADFATPVGADRATKRATHQHVTALERDTDAFFQEVGNPSGFVLPGETELGARLHVARTVARRAERQAVELHGRTPINPEALRYLNRLSSLLFALAAWTDKVAGGKTLRNPTYK